MQTIYDMRIKEKLGIHTIPEQKIGYFSHKIIHTGLYPSTKYKNAMLNRYASTENSYAQIFESGENATFEYNCLLFYILQKLTDRENCPTRAIGILPTGAELAMAEDIETFKEQIAYINAIEIRFMAGEAKVRYHLSVDRIMNIVKISIRRFHPEELTSSNILKLLTTKLNEGIRFLNMYENLQK